jgi:hypothetical protein
MVLLSDGWENGAADSFLVANLRGMPMKRQLAITFLIALTVAVSALVSPVYFATVNATTVSLDGKQLNFLVSSLDDSWSLHFVYSHSTHDVAINMQSDAIPEFPASFLAVFLAITFTILLCLRYQIKKKCFAILD